MDESAIDRAAARIRSASRVVVLTGAGMSTDSGIPDFRGPQGVWTRNPGAERLSSIDHYMNDPDVRAAAWQARRVHPAWTAEPNAAHRAIVDLERGGRLDTLVTQNIDGLHRRAGTSDGVLIEIHGTIHEVVCMMCGDRGPMGAVLERVHAGEADPPCRTCGGILKSATVSFGQPLRQDDIDRAVRAAAACDVFVAAGTSLSVYPVAYLPEIALAAGAALVIVNEEPTGYDDRAEALVRGRLARTLPEIVGRI